MNKFEPGDLVHIPAGVTIVRLTTTEDSYGNSFMPLKKVDKPIIGIYIWLTDHQSYYNVVSYKIFHNNDYWYVDPKYTYIIENENNNILKTKGYHLEHNFGHGKNHLSNLLLTLNLLAFLFHTALEMFDETYKRIRDDLPTRKTFFDDIRALTRYMCFNSWELMLTFMARGLELELPDTS